MSLDFALILTVKQFAQPESAQMNSYLFYWRMEGDSMSCRTLKRGRHKFQALLCHLPHVPKVQASPNTSFSYFSSGDDSVSSSHAAHLQRMACVPGCWSLVNRADVVTALRSFRPLGFCRKGLDNLVHGEHLP